MKKNILNLLLICVLSLAVTSCGDEKSDNLEDNLENRSDMLEERSDDLEDASDDVEDATDDIEDAMESLRDALEELDDPGQREQIRQRINQMIDELNMQQVN
jgi:DNA repair ATPase RecN